ncbi:MAG: undecaprenyldiphospho-muramoylpentapeptide beta-N-acetylglucosaminyltransferase [Planctomyces sp.]|nr:undecaprenyldiphospho-muramoylpentapeptide beta-N-acetylglucosaminyltransferase [Planctomyces sp.]
MGLRVLLAGGGTGGHLFPGIAVAEELEARDREIELVFAGSNRPIEKEIIDRSGYRHLPLEMESSTSFKRHPLRFLSRFRKSCQLASVELSRFNADVVVGLGGFASLPFILAARRQRRRVVLLEQNSIAGRATRFGSYLADELCLSFPDTGGRISRRPQRTITGNPVRKFIRNISEVRGANDGRPKLIVLGGSQGARSMNVEVVAALSWLGEELKEWEIVHQTGPEEIDRIATLYEKADLEVRTAPFFDAMDEVYANATLAICRAGATTLAELACVGCSAILYPYPGAIYDHQTANARYYADAGGAILMCDRRLNFTDGLDVARNQNTLGEQLRQLLRDPERLTTMSQAMLQLARPDAARQVADIILT